MRSFKVIRQGRNVQIRVLIMITNLGSCIFLRYFLFFFVRQYKFELHFLRVCKDRERNWMSFEVGGILKKILHIFISVEKSTYFLKVLAQIKAKKFEHLVLKFFPFFSGAQQKKNCDLSSSWYSQTQINLICRCQMKYLDLDILYKYKYLIPACKCPFI